MKRVIIVICLVVMLVGCSTTDKTIKRTWPNNELLNNVPEINFGSNYSDDESSDSFSCGVNCTYDEAKTYLKMVVSNLSDLSSSKIDRNEIYLDGIIDNNNLILEYKDGALSLTISKTSTE